MRQRPEYGCSMDFQVLAESSDYIAVNKPAPLIVHPTNSSGQPTLLGGLQQLLAFDLANGAQLSIINRLDRETSGVVLVAKNRSTARAFSQSMERRQVHKSYRAIVVGNPSWEAKEVDVPIANQRDFKTSKIWLKQAVCDQGKECRSLFEKVKDFDGFSLLNVVAETGRMHQIRVHAAYLGFPLVGDKIYGPDENLYLDHIEQGWTKAMAEKLLLRRQALHASCLTIPYGESTLSFEAPLANDLVSFLDRHTASDQPL